MLLRALLELVFRALGKLLRRHWDLEIDQKKVTRGDYFGLGGLETAQGVFSDRFGVFGCLSDSVSIPVGLVLTFKTDLMTFDNLFL